MKDDHPPTQPSEVQVRASLDYRAKDPKLGMTLDEMAQFIQAAMRMGVPGDAKLAVTLNWSSGIRKVETRVKGTT